MEAVVSEPNHSSWDYAYGFLGALEGLGETLPLSLAARGARKALDGVRLRRPGVRAPDLVWRNMAHIVISWLGQARRRHLPCATILCGSAGGYMRLGEREVGADEFARALALRFSARRPRAKGPRSCKPKNRQTR